MSKTKGIAKLVVNNDTSPTPQVPADVDNLSTGAFIHSTDSTSSRLWFSQGTSLSGSLSKLEFNVDSGFKISTENPINIAHKADLIFGTRGTNYWKIEGQNGSSGDLLPISPHLNIGRTGTDSNLANVYTAQITSSATLSLGASDAVMWTIENMNGHFVPDSEFQDIGSSVKPTRITYAKSVFSNNTEFSFGSGATKKWSITTLGHLLPNEVSYDIGSNTTRISTIYTNDLNVSGTLTGTVITTPTFVTDAIQTTTSTSSLSLKTGSGWPTRFTIDQNGSVGVGTTTPISRLHVCGSGNTNTDYADGDDRTSAIIIQSDQTEVNRGGQILFGGSAGIFAGIKGLLRNNSSGPAGDIVLQTRNTTGNVLERVRITSTGNVGIGTTNPSEKLEINGNIAITGAGRRITGDFSNATRSNRVMFQSSTLNGITNVYAIPNGNATASAFSISNNSNVDSSSVGQITINNDSFNINSTRIGTTANYLPLIFSSSDTPRLIITTDGNVGIGTTTPVYKLDVSDNIRCSSLVSNTIDSTELLITGSLSGCGLNIGSHVPSGGSSKNTYIDFNSEDSSKTADYSARIIRDQIKTLNFICRHTWASPVTQRGSIRLTLESNEEYDNTGWNTTHLEFSSADGSDPSYANPFFAPSGNSTDLGLSSRRWDTIYYSTLNPPSDIRLKSNIQDIVNAKNIILSVKPKIFNWKRNSKKYAGFIAQEFVGVLPEGVDVGSDDTIDENHPNFKSWSVDPFIIIPYLTKALQEAFNEIEQLKQELLELKNK